MNENNENQRTDRIRQSNWTSFKNHVTHMFKTHVTMKSCSNCLCCTGALTFSCGCGLVTLYLLAVNTEIWTESDVTINFKTFSVPGYVLVFIGQFNLVISYNVLKYTKNNSCFVPNLFFVKTGWLFLMCIYKVINLRR